MAATDVRPLAVRGSRLALAEVTVRLGNDFELNALQLVELDDHGLGCRFVFFDEDALAEALEELDARYLAEDGAADTPSFRATANFARLHRARDWDGLLDAKWKDRIVIRDVKLIDGHDGIFLAMPSRKLSDHCGRCGDKNHLRARYCNNCGGRLDENRHLRSRDFGGRICADRRARW